MKILYHTDATAIGGRRGSAASADGVLRVQLATPKALGGDGGDGTNPAQMFAAGYAARFLSAIKFVAAQSKTAVPADANVTASVDIGPNENGAGFGLDVALAVDLPGKTLTRFIVACPPRASSSPHTHARSAYIYAFVISGAIRSKVVRR